MASPSPLDSPPRAARRTERRVLRRGLALGKGRPTVICVTSGTAAAELHPAVVEAHPPGCLSSCAQLTGPPNCSIRERPKASTRWACSRPQPVGRPTRVCRQRNSRRSGARWPPVPTRRRPTGRRVPDRWSQPGVPRSPDRPTGASYLPSDRPTVATSASRRGRAPKRFHSGARAIIVGRPKPNAPRPRTRPDSGRALHWPVLADPRSECRILAIAAADAIVRTGPPPPETLVLLGPHGCPRPSASMCPARRNRVLGSRARSLAPMDRPDPSGHRVSSLGTPTSGSPPRASRLRPRDPVWLDAWGAMEEGAQRAIDETLGHELSEPQVAAGSIRPRTQRVVPRSSSRPPCRSAISSGSPRRSRRRRASWPTAAPTGSTASSRPRSASPPVAGDGRTIALMGDLAFLHDVSGLVKLDPARALHVRGRRQRRGRDLLVPAASGRARARGVRTLFGTPRRATSARWRAGSASRCTRSRRTTSWSRLWAAGARPLIQVRVPGRAENVALHEAINQAVRRARLT